MNDYIIQFKTSKFRNWQMIELTANNIQQALEQIKALYGAVWSYEVIGVK